MSVRQAQRQIDAAEFAAWMAYARLEPWGQPAEDFRLGVLAATVANGLRAVVDTLILVNGGRPPKRQGLVPADFMPQWGETPRAAVAPAELHTLFMMLTNAGIGTLTMTPPPERTRNGTRL